MLALLAVALAQTPLPLPPERDGSRASGLATIIGGPLVFVAGYLTFQFPTDDSRPPELYGLSSAPMGAGAGFTAYGAASLRNAKRMTLAARSGDQARLDAAVLERGHRVHLTNTIMGASLVATGAPFVAWGIGLGRRDARDGSSAHRKYAYSVANAHA
jgi:hypothetical protein